MAAVIRIEQLLLVIDHSDIDQDGEGEVENAREFLAEWHRSMGRVD